MVHICKAERKSYDRVDEQSEEANALSRVWQVELGAALEFKNSFDEASRFFEYVVHYSISMGGREEGILTLQMSCDCPYL